MKPTESSEEGQGRIGEGGGQQTGGLAVAPMLDPAAHRGELGDGSDAPVRSISGVVAAPAAGAELDEPHTTVDSGPARRFAAQELSGRIRHAMDRTLPLGTPAPDPSLFAAVRENRALHTRTMLLGGRYLAELGAAPEPPTRRADPALNHGAAQDRAAQDGAAQDGAAQHVGVRHGAGQHHHGATQSSAAYAAAHDAVSYDAAAHDAAAHDAAAHDVVSHDAVTPRAPEPPPTQRTPHVYPAVTPVPAAAAAPRFLSEAARQFLGVEATQHHNGAEAAWGSFAGPAERNGGSEPAAPEGALRASFVRPVGLPTVPPPRRRRTIPPGEALPFDAPLGSEPAAAPPAEDADHEAFALDRPRASSLPPGLAGASAREPAHGSTTAVSNGSPLRRAPVPFVRIPDARNPRSSALSNSVILPPPPQPHDYELASSPSAPPPPLAYAATARASSPPAGAAPAQPTTRPVARPRASLLDLPSVGNPLAGYEAPRETFWQRSLIVFVVALAVVGLFALGAIAFGFLGKTGW